MITRSAGLAAEIKIGFLGGITGEARQVVPLIRDSAHLALVQINRQGGILGSNNIYLEVRDTTCTNRNKAVSAATELIENMHVVAIVGAICSSATIAAAKNVVISANIAMISPASTARTLSTLKDNDLIFRTVQSDAYEAYAMARMLRADGHETIAIAYPDGVFGRMLHDHLSKHLGTQGSQISGYYAYGEQEENKGEYRKELKQLAKSGGRQLVVFGYRGGAGERLARIAVKTRLFDQLYANQNIIMDVSSGWADGKITLLKAHPWTGDSTFEFEKAAKRNGFDPTSRFAANAYDAAFILALAIEKAGSTNPAAIAAQIRNVANHPGEIIRPGEWSKAVTALNEGRNINYQGASGAIEFDEHGDVAGSYLRAIVRNGKIISTGQLLVSSQ